MASETEALADFIGLPQVGDIWKNNETGEHRAIVDFYKHPNHRSHHANWSGDYVVFQEYGNFKNEMKMIDPLVFMDTHTFAWGPLKVCRYCGFSRMHPCETRQTCPNLGL